MAEPLRRFLRSLNDAGVEYVVVGAHALAYHGYPRATQDLDILYLQTEENARRLADCIAERVVDVSHEDLAKRDLITNKRSTGRDRDRVDADAIDDA
jgi:hypothetical protein